MTRQELFDWCRQQYGTEPDYPWNDWNAVLRHTDNNKWYGIVLEVDRRKLGLADEGIVDILNVKCDPVMIGSLRMQNGFYPAYHMNKDKWISIMLDRPESDETIKGLLTLSYELTKGKSKKHYIIEWRAWDYEQQNISLHRSQVLLCFRGVYRAWA